jgi:8-amino-3,8-dideoxy-alpha-D-manno-octulosonate transaminase
LWPGKSIKTRVRDFSLFIIKSVQKKNYMPGMEVFGAEERKEVMDVLETGALFRYGHENIRKGMWKTREFEEEITRFTGARFAHAVSSGSSAVTTLMAAAGIGHGDEVIVPPFTFVAPVESVFLGGAIPVFGEIDETLCLSAGGIEKVLTSRTKAVLLVHMCGAAGDIEGIVNLCKKHNLVLIEDCGQAMGAFYKGKSVGLHGIGGSFSFDYFKIATCGEGGALITNDETIYHRMEQLADHGHTHIGNNRGMEDHHWIGFNYRLSELSAAVGLAQMRKLPGLIAENRKNKKYIKDHLRKFKDITFRTLPDEQGDSATFLNLFLPSAEVTGKVLARFEKDGIAGITYWYKNMYHFINQWDHIKNRSYPARLAVHHLGASKGLTDPDLRKSDNIMSRMISIGIRCTWTAPELGSYTDKIIQSLSKIIS